MKISYTEVCLYNIDNIEGILTQKCSLMDRTDYTPTKFIEKWGEVFTVLDELYSYVVSPMKTYDITSPYNENVSYVDGHKFMVYNKVKNTIEITDNDVIDDDCVFVGTVVLQLKYS